MNASDYFNGNELLKSDDPIFGNIGAPAADKSFVPSSATMLVSLFLILITFFAIIISHSELDMGKKNAALSSVQQKFGQSVDVNDDFGRIMPPKVNDIAVKLRNIFGDDAKIESSIDGTKTTVTIRKESFFYDDETQIRGDKYDKMINLQQYLKTEEDGNKLHITVLMGLEEYQRDRTRLKNIKNIIGFQNMDIGLTANDSKNLRTVFEHE